ncbi:MAG: TonB-dependent receptor [Gammaproteobacteria bacterium]
MAQIRRNALVPILMIGSLASAPAFAAFEEMIVSSERTDANLQDVPIAVTAITQEELENLQIYQGTDLQRYTPSLNMFNNVTSPTNLSPSLRGGLQQDASLISAESPFGIYIDDVFVGRLNGNNVQLTDIERVEVLRGPQGTLYGRNTAYGAMRFITKTPDDEFWFNADVGGGNYDQVRVNGSIGGPLGDSWAGSFSAQYNTKDGQFRNVATNEDVGLQENVAARGKIRYRGSDTFDATLSVSYVESENDSNQMPKGITPGIPSDCSGYTNGCDASVGRVAQFTTSDLVWVNGDYGVSTPVGQIQPPPLGDRPRGETEQTIAALNLAWDVFDDRLTIKSITGYVGLEDYFHTDFSGNTGSATQFFGFTGATDVDSDQWSQEFQALGTIGDNLSYIGGIYYLNEDATQQFGWNGYNMIFGPLPGGLVPGFAPVSQSDLSVETESIAVYGEASYNITEKLKATAGLRWTEDDKKFNADFTSLLGPPATVAVPLDGTWSEWTPKFALDYLFDTSGSVDSMLLYGSAAKGFKGGGFSAIAIFSDSDFAVYGPETNWTYEGGLKGEFFGNQLRTNLAYFFSDIKDIQQNATVDLGGGQVGFPVQNSGDAEIQGLEYEITWSPLDSLNVFLIGNFLDGEYKNLVDDSAAGQAESEFGVPAIPPQVPDFTVTIGFDYAFEMPGNFFGETKFGMDYYKTDDYVSSATNDFYNDGWDMLNGFVAIQFADKWEARLSGKNLADDVIVVSGSRALGGFVWLPPQEILFQIFYRN